MRLCLHDTQQPPASQDPHTAKPEAPGGNCEGHSVGQQLTTTPTTGTCWRRTELTASRQGATAILHKWQCSNSGAESTMPVFDCRSPATGTPQTQQTIELTVWTHYEHALTMPHCSDQQLLRQYTLSTDSRSAKPVKKDSMNSRRNCTPTCIARRCHHLITGGSGVESGVTQCCAS